MRKPNRKAPTKRNRKDRTNESHDNTVGKLLEIDELKNVTGGWDPPSEMCWHG